MVHDLVLHALQRNKLNDLQDFLQDQRQSKIHNLLHDSWSHFPDGIHDLRNWHDHGLLPIPILHALLLHMLDVNHSCRSIVAAKHLLMEEPASSAQHVRTCRAAKASGHTCWAARVASIQTHRRCESHWLKPGHCVVVLLCCGVLLLCVVVVLLLCCCVLLCVVVCCCVLLCVVVCCCCVGCCCCCVVGCCWLLLCVVVCCCVLLCVVVVLLCCCVVVLLCCCVVVLLCCCVVVLLCCCVVVLLCCCVVVLLCCCVVVLLCCCVVVLLCCCVVVLLCCCVVVLLCCCVVVLLCCFVVVLVCWCVGVLVCWCRSPRHRCHRSSMRYTSCTTVFDAKQHSARSPVTPPGPDPIQRVQTALRYSHRLGKE